MSDAEQAAAAASFAKTASDLGWDRLLDAIAGLCAGEIAAARLLELTPAPSLAEARDRMQRTAEALAALAEGDPVPARAVPVVEATLHRLARGGQAGAEELYAIVAVLVAARRLRPYAHRRQDTQPALAAVLTSDPTLDELADELETAIDPGGHINDAASWELEDARRRVRVARRSLVDKLEQLADRYADVLRDRRHVEREGRYGLPVRADAHRRVEGIVLGSSGSGATLYVEPRQITELGNRLKIAESDAEREEARVLAALSAQVAEHGAAVAEAHEACVEADVLAALARWAEQCQAVALPPEPEPFIDLRALRHPLLVLQKREVVANDVAVKAGEALVISGPNAGGKTVALTSLGLAAWMARSGIPLPVQETDSKIGWFATVLTDVGDAQSIELSLSTFSAQITNLSSIVGRADGHTLVLLDELAGGTDPEQGAALAGAVLEALVERGCAVAATTHYERLKELSARSERFTNASVGFDVEQLRPTFALHVGVPGSSSALAIATRHGLPDSIVERARALLPAPVVMHEQLLADLERERRELAAARAEAESEAAQAAQLRSELATERQHARQKERQRLAREAEHLTTAVQQARGKLRSLAATLGGDADPSRLRAARREVDEAGKLVAIDSPLAKAIRPPERTAGHQPVSPDELKPGMQVFVERLATSGEVLEAPKKGQLRVRAGAFTLQVPVAEVRLAKPAKRSSPKRPVTPARPTRGPRPRPAAEPGEERELRTTDNTCDLRGQRVDEALDQVDAFLDQCLRTNEPVGFVLHGHGTGALKRAVREHLAGHALVARCRPAIHQEGGDAFTVFWLTER